MNSAQSRQGTENNKTASGIKPNYYIQKVPGDMWVFFPHEFHGLTPEEIEIAKGPEIFDMYKKLISKYSQENSS